MKEYVDFKDLASVVFFAKGAAEIRQYIEKKKILFKKSARFGDIAKMRHRAMKSGKFKTEDEMGFLEIYLKMYVFKTVRGK